MSAVGATPAARACSICATADLTTIGGDTGVVRHVLGFERANLQAAPRIGPCQARDQKRLTNI